MADVVAVPHEGQGPAAELAEVLAQGEEVGQRLARVLVIGKGVDDGDRCGPRQLDERSNLALRTQLR